jgi:hypothetical protein
MEMFLRFIAVFLIMTAAFAIPFIGVALLWIYLISTYEIAGLILSIAATMALWLGWYVTVMAYEDRKQRRW